MADESFDFIGTTEILLGVEDDSLYDTLQIYLEITRQAVLNYCNISKLPSALNYTVCQLTADAYRNFTNANKVGEVIGNVATVSEDGRSVTFSSSPSSIEGFVTSKVEKMRELNRFKKLYRI